MARQAKLGLGAGVSSEVQAAELQSCSSPEHITRHKCPAWNKGWEMQRGAAATRVTPWSPTEQVRAEKEAAAGFGVVCWLLAASTRSQGLRACWAARGTWTGHAGQARVTEPFIQASWLEPCVQAAGQC